jgi:predicted ribosome quality control (RQC) complex YloA/Tae2 family protein
MKEKSVKIPFDSLTLHAIVSELNPLLIGGYVQHIRQPEPTAVWLDIRTQGRNVWLILSCDTRFARVHLTESRPHNPPAPPNFCMVLRKYIEDGRITDVRQREFDRIFEMDVERRDDLGEPTTYTLIAELMGKHSNLILLNEGGIILDAAKRIPHRINRFRETLPNRHYIPPPEQADRLSPFDPNALIALLSLLSEQSQQGLKPLSGLQNPPSRVDLSPLSDLGEEIRGEIEPAKAGFVAQNGISMPMLSSLLLNSFDGMSPFLAQEITARATQSDNLETGLAQAWQEIFGAAEEEEFTPVEVMFHHRTAGAYPFPVVQLPEKQQQTTSSLNAALDRSFATARVRAEFDAAAGDLRTRIDQEMKRLERQRESQARTLQEVERAEDFKRLADLILANVWRIEPGMEAVTVQDYFDPALPETTIPLDAKLTPQENAESLFRRYRKARDSEENALTQSQRIADSYRELRLARERLLGWQQSLEETADAVRELRDELVQSDLLRMTNETEEGEARSGPDFEGHRIRRHTTPEGYEIYVGESATANDFLTTRVATPNDLWLHVRSATSAHVVIRTHGKPEDVPRSVLQQAALLCARNSSQKHSKLIAVDYTLKKYVRKPRGSAPGSVDYTRETTLHVTP